MVKAMAYQSRNIVLMAFHIVALVFALFVTLFTAGYVLMADENRTPYHIVNTFLSAYNSESPLNTYIPVNKIPTLQQVQETYYGCLQKAEVAVDDVYNCKNDSLDQYKTCLANLVNLQFRVKRIVLSVKQILGQFKGDSIEIVQLPTWLTSVDTPALLETYMSRNDTRYALKQQLAAQSNQVSVQILDAIKTAEEMTGIPACFDLVSSHFLSEYSASYDISTAFNGLWKCTSDVLLVEPIHKRAYDKCIPLSMWPAKDIMQTPYTDTLLGSYNKYFVMWIGLWLLCSFIVYTSPGYPSAGTENGKPKHFMARAGKTYVTFGFIWNIAAIIIVLVRTFSPADAFKNAPMSIQTAFLSLFFTIAATVYFGREVYELFFLAEKPPNFKFKGTSTKVSGSLKKHRYNNGRAYQGIAAFMDPASYVPHTQIIDDEDYLPLVAPVWNDAWFFVDALLFLAMAGMSYDVVTVDLNINVFCLIAANLCNSSLVRLLYEGYIDSQNKMTAQQSGMVALNINDSVFTIRVMGVIAAVSGLFFSLVGTIITWTRFGGSETVTLYVIFTSLLPQLMWLILVLAMEFMYIKTNKGFYYFTSMFFAFNVYIRVAFMCWILSVFNRDYDLTEGNSDSLNNLLAYVNTESALTPSYI
jgi:hypothetical protein